MTAYAALVESELAHGFAPAVLAAELGIKPGSVARALEREGRPDLALPFWRADYAARDHSAACVDCGARVYKRRVSRCHRCGTRARDLARAAARSRTTDHAASA